MPERIESHETEEYAFVVLLDKMGMKLCERLETQLFRFAGQSWWKKNVVGILTPEDQQKIASQGWNSLQDLDIHLLLKVFDRNYGFLKRQLRLPQDGRDLIHEVRQIRNRCVGHRPIRGNPSALLAIDIRTLVTFCKDLLQETALAGELAALAEAVEHGARPPILSPLPVPALPPAVVAAVSTPPESRGALREMFEGFELTPSQVQAADRIEAFLADPTRDCFVTKGYAGTGKTFLLGGLVRYLQQANKTFVLLAPTGRAAHVIKERHKLDANTIHRQIYAMDKLREFREADEKGNITYKFYFEPRNNDTQHDMVFIVDESSMVSDVYTEAEFIRFGSGRLLRDFLEYVNFDGNDYRKKVIFVGDDAQLPPVDMNFSPALREDYLAKYVRSRVESCELTDVVRQDKGGLILKNATVLRELLASGRLTSFDFESDGKTAREATPEVFLSSYLEHVASEGTAATVIVGYSNAQAKTYNEYVRQHLFPGADCPVPADRVMVIRNCYCHEVALFNGQMGTVQQVGDTVEKHVAILNIGLDEHGARKNVRVELSFRRATIRFETSNGQTRDIEGLYIEELLTSGHRELSSEQSKALYVDFKNRHPQLKPGNADFVEMLKRDPYFNALQIKYAYAVTCHKAQGGEWPTVFVDFQGQNKLDPMAIRWSYTALTRASRNVVVTNALHHGILTPLRQIPSNPPPICPSAATTGPSEAVDGGASSSVRPAFLAQASTIDMHIHDRLRKLLPETIKIDSLASHNYLSQWTVSQGPCVGIIKVHYNGRHKITSVLLERLSEGDWSVPLREAAHRLKGVSVAGAAPPAKDVVARQHPAFHQAIQARSESLGIRVCEVDDLTAFHTRYRFERDDDSFRVNYYFDGGERFTKMDPETGLPEHLLQVLDQLHRPNHN